MESQGQVPVDPVRLFQLFEGYLAELGFVFPNNLLVQGMKATAAVNFSYPEDFGPGIGDAGFFEFETLKNQMYPYEIFKAYIFRAITQYTMLLIQDFFDERDQDMLHAQYQEVFDMLDGPHLTRSCPCGSEDCLGRLFFPDGYVCEKY